MTSKTAPARRSATKSWTDDRHDRRTRDERGWHFSTHNVISSKGPKDIALVKLPKVPNADEIEENRVLSELFGSLWLMKSRVSACLDLNNDLKNRR